MAARGIQRKYVGTASKDFNIQPLKGGFHMNSLITAESSMTAEQQ
jgi:hypothetical protein